MSQILCFLLPPLTVLKMFFLSVNNSHFQSYMDFFLPQTIFLGVLVLCLVENIADHNLQARSEHKCCDGQKFCGCFSPMFRVRAEKIFPFSSICLLALFFYSPIQYGLLMFCTSARAGIFITTKSFYSKNTV